MIYIGVDPGMRGGWTIMWPGGEIETHPWDDKQFIESMEDVGCAGSECRCAVEKVGAMPKQGLGSTFKFGEEYGMIQGILKGLHIPYQTVPPQTWKKEFSLLHQDKGKSIETAQRLFPEVNFLPTERSRKPSDGMCESALICEWARRKL